MQIKQKNGIRWLEFDLLANIPNLKHGIFLRSGGFSQDPYASLNLGETYGDNLDHVKANQKAVSDILGVSELIWIQQCHGVTIQKIEKPFRDHPKGDSLITSQSGRALMVLHADCQAAIFYDPVHHAVANVHCGWRGNVQNIYSETVRFMQKTYNTHTKDLLVCISPSLGPQKSEFINYRTELPESFWGYQVKPNFFDLWEISRDQLKSCGVLDQHIEIASICTYTNAEDFFSYRRDKVCGRNGTIVLL